MKSPDFCMPKLNNKGQPPKEMQRGARIFSGLSHSFWSELYEPPASVLKEARASALRIRKTHRFPRGGNGVPGSAPRGHGERGIFIEAPCCRTAHLKNPCAARKDTIFGGEPLYEDPQILYVRIIEKGFPSKEMPRALRAAFFRGNPISLDGRLPNSGGLIYGTT